MVSILQFPEAKERDSRKRRFVATHMEKVHGIVVVPGDILIKDSNGEWRKQ